MLTFVCIQQGGASHCSDRTDWIGCEEIFYFTADDTKLVRRALFGSSTYSISYLRSRYLEEQKLQQRNAIQCF